MLWLTMTVWGMHALRAPAGDYVFVVDTSGSMRERVSRKTPETKIATVQNNLRQHLLALPPDSRLSLISFNTGLKGEREVILRSEADRQAVIEWVNGLEPQTRANGSTHLWAALRRGLTVASDYSRQNPNQTVLVRVLTDGMDNDPQYRGRSAGQVLRQLQAGFPAVDGEKIRANLVLLGDLELDVRTWPGLHISHDPNFTVIFPPVIAWEPSVVRVGTNVVFSEQSRFRYHFYDWWIDGQKVSSQASVSHVFTNAGRHAVRLQVASADGLREADTKTVEVLEAEKPAPLVTRITFLPAAPQPGERVRFVGWATGQGITFSWRLNGEEFAAGAEAERVFEQEGRYDITLMVMDGTGRSERTNQVVTVAERPLRVAFSAPAEAQSGQDIQFANETQPTDRVREWAWDFGDGSTSAEQNPRHRFINEGDAPRSFPVVLRATTRSGKAYAASPQAITVLPAQKPVPPPKAAFRILGGPFRAGRMVAFQEESHGLIEAFRWDFNGEGSDERKNPEFRFETPGAKTIRLTVRGPGGADTASQQITVEPREVSAQLVWLNTNGQSIPLPAKLDYGTANPIHVRNQELIVNVDDTFEVLLPAERPPDCAITLALDEAAARVFALEQRVADRFQPLAVPARLQDSGRFRLQVRRDAAEGECDGALVVRAEGAGLLLNGRAEPITLAVHINLTSGGAALPVRFLVLLAVGAALLAWGLVRKRPLTYPVELTLGELAPSTASAGTAEATPRAPSRTFRLERVGDMVCLGADPDHKHVYDLNAPDWFIMARDKTLDLCSRSATAGRRLQSGRPFSVIDAVNRTRQVRATFASVPKQRPDDPKNRNT